MLEARVGNMGKFWRKEKELWEKDSVFCGSTVYSPSPGV
jgi:hypothetical protein